MVREKDRKQKKQRKTERYTEFENKVIIACYRLKNMEEVVLLIDDLRLLSGISRCRICHEEEFESSKALEAPCSCSGTVKVRKEKNMIF